MLIPITGGCTLVQQESNTAVRKQANRTRIEVFIVAVFKENEINLFNPEMKVKYIRNYHFSMQLTIHVPEW
jgi:hypothetical protein